MAIISRRAWLSRHQFLHKLCIVIVIIILVHMASCLYKNINSSLKDGREVEYIQFKSYQNLKEKSPSTKPTILYWKQHTYVDPFECISKCPFQCKITQDENEIERADAVDFDLSNLWSDNWNIGSKATTASPTYRRPDQIWTVTNLEPPSNLFGDLSVFNGVFNWTMWYRKDATLYHPYGMYSSLNDNEIETAENELKKRNFYKEKTGNIIGMVSNCKDPEQRYRLIADMTKYLNITMYGKCFDKVCGDPFNFVTCENLTSTYKFYLGLENSRCKDYITEKYWHSLHREQIPIVNWDFNHIDRSIPVPGSFISVSDFETIEDLAKYVEKVSNDEALYNSYFEWKKKYRLGHRCHACLLCEALHKPIQPQTVVNFDGWVRHDVCAKVNKFNIKWWNWKRDVFMKLGI